MLDQLTVPAPGRQCRHSLILELVELRAPSSSTSTAARDRSPSATWTARTVAAKGETSGVSIFIASITTSGSRAATVVARRDVDADHGARHRRDDARRSRPPPPCAVRRLDVRAAATGGGGGRLRRNGPPHAGAGAAVGGAESGGCSLRNAVVMPPARTRGCATSQRRNGRFVVTPPTSVSRERARAAGDRLLARVAVRDQLRDHRVVARPDLVALVDARVDAHAGRAAAAARSVPACGRKLRGSSAYSRTSTACPRKRPSASSALAVGDPDLRRATMSTPGDAPPSPDARPGCARSARGTRTRARRRRTRPCRRSRSRSRARTAIAASLSRARSSASSAGDGDSSSTFWWRRWIEQSRSPSATHRAVRVGQELDLDVARRARGSARRRPCRRRTPPAPRAAPPSSASSSSPAARTTRMPAPAAAGGRLDQQREAELLGRPARRRRERPASRRDPLRRELVAARARAPPAAARPRSARPPRPPRRASALSERNP